MMKQIDPDSIRSGLMGGGPEDQAEALKLAKSLFERVARDAVDALRRGPNRFIVAERLHWLGSVCREPLQEILSSSAAGEAKILASLVLIQLGSRKGLQVLLDAISSGSEYSGLSASFLVKQNIKEAVPVVLRRLNECPLDHIDEIVSLVAGLEGLGHSLPQQLILRFRQEGVPWQVRSLVEQYPDESSSSSAYD